jgi:hypothetical protein
LRSDDNLHAAFIEILNGGERLGGVELRVADEQVKSVAAVPGLGRSLELFVGELKRCDSVLPE